MSKTIAMTLEVLTRSTVTVMVEVPDGVGPCHYGYIGKALFDGTPEAMFSKSVRTLDRVSFDKIEGVADLAVRLNGDGKVELVKKDDLVQLTLADSGDLDDDRQIIFCSGEDADGREIITSPATPDEIECLTIKVIPDLPEVREEAIALMARSLFKGVIPGSVEVKFESFDAKALKWMGEIRYMEVVTTIRRPRFAFTLSTYDEFSRYLFGLFGEDDSNLSTADFAHGYSSYLKERSLTLVK